MLRYSNPLALGILLVCFVILIVVEPAEALKPRLAGVSGKPNILFGEQHRVSVAPIQPCANEGTGNQQQQQQQQQQQRLPVLTKDLVDLSDLRYNEWMKADVSVVSENEPPSQYAFRMATAEIALERSEAGAVAFLARWQNSNETMTVAVGAAELSPVEFEGTLLLEEDDTSRVRWYVTDVVTSSNHRRMGVANLLMDEMERYAFLRSETTSVTLYLHVKSGNDAAMAFYQNPKRGYAKPTRDELTGLNVDKLACNAGTEGQILLCKTLAKDNVVVLNGHYYNNDETTAAETATTVLATGFGKPKAKHAQKKKKAKRKRK